MNYYYYGTYWDDDCCSNNAPGLCKISVSTASTWPSVSKSGYMASCSPFSVTDTSSTTQNYASCHTIACAGDTLTLLLSEHTGDYYLLLFGGSKIKVAEFFYFLKYTVPANTGCTNYEIREGCSGSGSCGGTVTIMCTGKCAYDIPSRRPTSVPLLASAVPSTLTQSSPGGLLTCPTYSASNTAYGTLNYITCPFTLCGGDRVVISLGCDCTGNTFIQLYDSTGTFLASNNDYCGQCSALSYTALGGAACSTYVLREACNSFGSCSGTASIKIHSPSPTSAPTISLTPTLSPRPPTLIPSKSPIIPTGPTTVPSMAPSAPSFKPSSQWISSISAPSIPTFVPTTNTPTASPTLFSAMYTYTGSVQTYSVGAGRHSLTITACGAQGRSTAYSTGGFGGCITTNIDVAPFQTLYIFVGGGGSNSSYNEGGGADVSGSGGAGAPSSAPATSGDVKTSLSGGEVAGIAIGILMFSGLCCWLSYCCSAPVDNPRIPPNYQRIEYQTRKQFEEGMKKELLNYNEQLKNKKTFR
eukprot:gene10884-22727_t